MLLKTLVLFLTLTFSSSVWCLKCYQCFSIKDRGCEPLDTAVHKPRQCMIPISSDLCVVHYAPSGGGEMHAERKCATSVIGDPCAGTSETGHTCRSCSTDGCNEASSNNLRDGRILVFLVAVQLLLAYCVCGIIY